MRQKKNFFTRNNTLNKVGVTEQSKVESSQDSVLEPKTLLEYEKQIPGFAEKLFDLAKADQVHFQKMEDIKNNMAKNALRMGRLSFVFLFIVICYFSYNLILAGLVNESYIFSAISFFALIMLNCKARKSCNVSKDKISKPNNRPDKKYHRKSYSRRRQS